MVEELIKGQGYQPMLQSLSWDALPCEIKKIEPKIAEASFCEITLVHGILLLKIIIIIRYLKKGFKGHFLIIQKIQNL